MGAALVEWQRRRVAAAAAATKAAAIRESLFDRQRALIDDEATTKAALCSRRAGKTHTCVAYLLITALTRPRTVSVYVALTRLSAKRLIWRALMTADATHGLRAVINHTELTVTLPNGSAIIVTGAHDEADAERLRGGKYALVVVDECASFPGFFSSMVEEVIEPALVDEQGTLCLVGSPGAAVAGLFHAATTGEMQYSTHHWTILDNPHLPHARAYLARKRAEKKWTDESPIYRREWLGQWVRSSDGMVYRYDPLRNDGEPPPGEYAHVLGIDLGYNDAFAISVLAFALDRPEVWVIDEFSRSGLLPGEWGDAIEKYRDRYAPIAMVADAGALGKPIVLEMVKRRGLALEFAEKKEKAATIELLNDDLTSGRMKIKPGLRVADEMTRLQWDPDTIGTMRRKEDERYPNNSCDATLYAWRRCQHWTQRAADPLPGEGTAEKWAMDAAAAKAAKIRATRRSREENDE